MGYPLKTKKAAWDSIKVPNLLGGINTSLPPMQLADNQASMLQNVTVKSGQVYSDTGYAPRGQEVIGHPQRSYRFKRRDLSEDLILITTSTVYKWDDLLVRWLLLSSGTSTTTMLPYAAGATDIVVVDPTGFNTGDIAYVELDNGDQLQGTITVVGATFTFSAAVPVGRTVNLGAVVAKASMLSGTLDKHVSITTVPGSDWLVFTNGVDIVKRYDGSTVQNVPNLPSAGNVICRAVIVYNTALFLIGTIEGGIRYNQRVRRSNQTDPTDWTGGTAGTDDLLDLSDSLLEAALLGPYLIVYRETGIVRGVFSGVGGISYRWDTTVTNEGAISAGAIATLGEEHIFVGHDNIYIYRGDFAIEPIGEAVFDLTLGYRGDMDPVFESKTFVVYIPEIDEVWIFYVSNASTGDNCDKVIRYNLTKKFWYTRVFADEFVGHGFHRKNLTVSWSSATGTWATQIGYWTDKRFSSLAPVVQLCSANTNNVMDYDYIEQLDNGTPISYIAETKDFSLGDAELRHDTFEMYMRGTNVQLEYSTDGGISYVSMATINQSTIGRVTVGVQFVFNKVRFRWTGSSADFILEWFGFTYKVESLTGFSNNNL